MVKMSVKKKTKQEIKEEDEEDEGDEEVEEVERAMEDWLKIVPMETDKSKIKLRGSMKSGIIAPHPNRTILNGCSGSGKTVLLVNLLTNKKLYADYYDLCVVLSLTANILDDSYSKIKQKSKKTKIVIINELDASIIEDVMKTNLDIIEEKGTHKAPKILIILDDCICNKEFMKSDSLAKIFVMGRHHSCSVWLATQRFASVPRVARLQASQLFLFKCTGSEIKTLVDEFKPANFKRREFENLVHYATRDDYTFLNINMHVPSKLRFRRNLDEILEIK
jgi:hypothetical protein